MASIWRITFATEDTDSGQAFSYQPSKKKALAWIKEECPHDMTVGYDLELESVTIPTSNTGLCEYLNHHHTYWK